ncbi:hypothetical protein D8674_017152 [Pyrus ussuriensis x Pyrus communis]|uniref:Uncharacterized protein n=1 Tax=Pyrus ussuriensis x Pyrus communis TaxID=2448454 RepID=A0A5N5HHB6_9ROSA|nr:hypothetical protein D8674_017152 [Pyrus ussuriensis x Pyrus communis]
MNPRVRILSVHNLCRPCNPRPHYQQASLPLAATGDDGDQGSDWPPACPFLLWYWWWLFSKSASEVSMTSQCVRRKSSSPSSISKRKREGKKDF